MISASESDVDRIVVRQRAAAAREDLPSDVGPPASPTPARPSTSDAELPSLERATREAESLLSAGRPYDARAWLEDALANVDPRRDRGTLRRATLLLGAAEFALGDLDDAGQTIGRALELEPQEGDQAVVAGATYYLGAIARVQGRLDDALASFQLAGAAYQRLGDPQGLSLTFHHMAATFRDLDELAQAEQYERWAAEYADEGNNAHLQAEARLGHAELDLRRGDATNAEAAARGVASTFERLGDPIAQADALRVVGVACIALGRLDAAREALDGALALARRFGSALGEAETLRAAAELADARGDHAEMRRLAQAAFALFSHMGAMEEARRLVVWVTERAGRA